MSPLTAFITWLLKSPRSREAAGQEARRLGVRIDWARFYFNTIGRKG